MARFDEKYRSLMTSG
ncbi:hypothetical protein, partial [Frankia sp. AvcI1]